MNNRLLHVSAPGTFVELAGGVSAARALLASLGMTRQDGTGEREALLVATGRVVFAGCSFRLRFDRDMVLRMVGMVGGGSLLLAAKGMLTVPARLAHTITTSSIDRPISEIVTHPVLAAAPLIVAVAEPLTESTYFELTPEIICLVEPGISTPSRLDGCDATKDETR